MDGGVNHLMAGMSGVVLKTAPLLIVGGGHTGLLLALALDRAGFPVTVIEAEPIESILDAPFDGRALALMYGSKRVFDALGLWPAFESLAQVVMGVRVLDRATGATVTYDAAEVGEHPFAYGIEHRTLRRRLLELALERPGIDLVAPARLSGVARTADAIVLSLGRDQLQGALVIGADGRASSVRQLAAIPLARWSYPQVAITCAIRHERDHGARVLEFLHPAGPLALLPLGERLSAVTWVERRGDAEALLRGGREILHAALIERLAGELGELELIGSPAGYPLSGQRARRFVGPRLALIGDAAHAVHPIHAQGFNLAVRDVAALAEVLVDAARAGQDPGNSETLLRYERWRQVDVGLVVTLTDGLNRLFSNDLAPAKLVRSLGLAAVDRLPPLKQLAMRRGMGLLGDLPRLARGEAL